MRTVRDDPGLTGAEKLQKMFWASWKSDQTDLFVLAPNMLKTPADEHPETAVESCPTTWSPSAGRR